MVQQQSADLRITKSVTPLKFAEGGNLTYTVTLTNFGPTAAQNVVVKDDLPASTSFVSAVTPAGWISTLPAINGAGNASFRKPSVAVGETATFQIVVRPKSTPVAAPAPEVKNTVTVESATADPLSNNSAEAISTLQVWTTRLMVQREDVGGKRGIITTEPPEPTIQFSMNGLLRGLPRPPLDAIKDALKNETTAKLGLVELAASDALATTRLDFIFSQLGLAGLLGINAIKRVVPMRPNEQTFLQLTGGGHADDVVFVSVNPELTPPG
jgi:uncharacterized repeat protein (TIGR01451 family)